MVPFLILSFFGVALLSTLPTLASVRSPILLSIPVTFEYNGETSRVYLYKGQSYIDAAREFCQSHDLSNEMKDTLIPKLAKALEETLMKEVVQRRVTLNVEVDSKMVPVTHNSGGDIRSESELFCRNLDFDSEESEIECIELVYRGIWSALEDSIASTELNDKVQQNPAQNSPLFSLPVSLDETQELMVNFDSSSNPEQVASEFCNKVINRETDMASMLACFDNLSKEISGRIQFFNLQYQSPPANTTIIARVPLTLNGIASELDLLSNTTPLGMARVLCSQSKFGMVNMGVSAIDDCLLQVANVAAQAIQQYNARERQQADEFLTSNSVPITIGDDTWTAYRRPSESVMDSSERFCSDHHEDLIRVLGLTDKTETELKKMCLGTVSEALENAMGANQIAEADRVIYSINVDAGEGRMIPLQIHEGDTAKSAVAKFLSKHGFGQEYAGQLERALQDKLSPV